MATRYEQQADESLYCYFVRSGTRFDQNNLYTIFCSPHFHRNVEFLFITKGSQTVTVNGVKSTLSEGDILFVDSFSPHNYDKCDAEAYILVLSTTYFDQFKRFHNGKSFPKIMNGKEKNKAIFDFISSWHEENVDKNDSYRIFVRCNELFMMLENEHGVVNNEISRQNELVIDALKYIESNYCDDISLESCANSIGYSNEYISKQFNAVMGISFKSYINSLRIKKFKELENNSNLSKQDLAKQCGFRSATTFYRALNNEGD